MSCCNLYSTDFISEIIEDANNAQINYPINQLLSPYSPSISGMWRPIYYNQTPLERLTPSEAFDEGYKPCNSPTPDGMGISNFLTIPNITLKKWDAQNVSAEIDWIVKLYNNDQVLEVTPGQEWLCKTYQYVILGWYRYFNIGIENDDRLIPGVDFYISDGDFAFIEGEPLVSYRLLSTAYKIQNQLISFKNVAEAKLMSSILATGPQIDWITVKLSSSDNGSYERDDYGLIIDLLRKMSSKPYTDIGAGNFIKTKSQLVRKLVRKYGFAYNDYVSSNPDISTKNRKRGARLVVQPGTYARLASKFNSITGPNISISPKGSAFFLNPINAKNYGMSIGVGNITGGFFPYDQRINDSGAYVCRVNDSIVRYYLMSATGLFDPKLKTINFHGLGGLSIDSDLRRDELGYHDDKSPYFIQNTGSQDSLIQDPSKITIDIFTNYNTKYYLTGIDISYLRTDSHPECKSFIDINESRSCNCIPLADPSLTNIISSTDSQSILELKGIGSYSNSNDIIYTPSYSYYYMPTGTIKITNEKLPKIHNIFFPKDDFSSYKSIGLHGCGSKYFNLNVPFPGKITVFQDYGWPTNVPISLTYRTRTKEETINNSNYPKQIIFNKTTEHLDNITISINPPITENSEWYIYVFLEQFNYGEIKTTQTLNLPAQKGFFHPNSGWLSNTTLDNCTSLINEHRYGYIEFETKKPVDRICYECDKFYANFPQGFNFLLSQYDLTDNQKIDLQKISDTGNYIGISSKYGGYYITKHWNKRYYTSEESPILDMVEFKYLNINSGNMYPLSDFTFSFTNNNSLESLYINSYNSIDRVLNANGSGSVIKFKSMDFQDQSGGGVFSITSDGKAIPKYSSSKYPSISGGYAYFTEQFVIVYSPNYTLNDKDYSGGKWGNLLYGDSQKYLQKINPYIDRHNLFTTLTSGTEKTKKANNVSALLQNNNLFTWASPIKIETQNYKLYYTPLINNKTNKTLSFKDEADKIISEGVCYGLNNNIYIGPYYQQLAKITIIILGHFNINYVELWCGDERLGTAYKNLEYTYVFDSIIIKCPILYVRIIPVQNCPDNQTSLAYEDVSFEYSVQLLSTNNMSIGYYKHKPINKYHGIQASYANGASYGFLPYSPLFNYYPNIDDYTPFLDIKVPDSNWVFPESSGSVYFMDAVKPKSSGYIPEINYNKDLFWIDIPYDRSWNFLTTQGYVLEAGKSYTVLKSIKYICDDNAAICSQRYPKDLCSVKTYDLTMSQMLNLIGLSDYHRNLLEITTISFPDYCDKINYCCDPNDSNCLARQRQQIISCYNNWKNSYSVTCDGVTCSDKIKGNINIQIETYVIKLRENIVPDSLSQRLPGYATSGQNPLAVADRYFSFFYDTSGICHSESEAKNISVKNYTTYPCSFDRKECQYIENINGYGLISTYSPGYVIDDPFNFGSDGSDLKAYSFGFPYPSSIILANEKIYRDTFDHNNKISGSFYDYDLLAETNYEINYKFNMYATGCIPIYSGFPFATIGLDNTTLYFQLETDAIDKSGQIVIKSWFTDGSYSGTLFNNLVIRDPNSVYDQYYEEIIEQTEYESYQLCDTIFPKPSFDPNNPSEYYKNRSATRVVKVEDISSPDDYTLVTRYCPPIGTGCSYTYYGGETSEKICCPKGSYLYSDSYGNRYCRFDYTQYQVGRSGVLGCDLASGAFRDTFLTYSISGTSNSSPVIFSGLIPDNSSSGESLCAIGLSGYDPSDIITYSLVKHKTQATYVIDRYEDKICSCGENANKLATYANSYNAALCAIYPCITACGGNSDCINNCYNTQTSSIDSAQNNIGLSYTKLEGCTLPSNTYISCNYSQLYTGGGSVPDLITSYTKDECGSSCIDENNIMTGWYDYYNGNLRKTTSASKCDTVAITSTLCSRDYTEITVIKQPLVRDPSKYTFSTKAYHKKYRVVLENTSFDPNQPPSPGACRNNETKLNLTLDARLYNNFIALSLTNNYGRTYYNTNVQNGYLDRDTNKLFLCPRISYSSYIPELRIFDTSSTIRTNLEIGKLK